MRRYTFHSQNYAEPKVFTSNEDLEEIWSRVDADECRLATGDLVKVECEDSNGGWWTFGCYILAAKWESLLEKEFDAIVKLDRHLLAGLVRTVQLSGWCAGVANNESEEIWVVTVHRILDNGSKQLVPHKDDVKRELIVYKDLDHAKRDFSHMVHYWRSDDPNEWYGSSIYNDVSISKASFK